MHVKYLSGVLLLAASAAVCAAPVSILQSDVIYELLPDGTSTVERDVVTRINEQSAVTGAGQTGLTYSESMQQLEILDAYTTTKDGRRVDVPRDRILTRQSPISASAPTYSDNKIMVVVFPQLEIGATTTLRYRQKQVKSALPGVFSGGEVFNRFAESETAKNMTLRAPENVAMNVFARRVPGGPVQPSRPGTREWRWTQGPVKAEVVEQGMVDAASISPGVMFTTLKDYPALADAYMASAAPMAKVTPAVQKLADEITQGIAGHRAQAEALYRWICSEVRTVQVSLGTGSYVPHPADEVITTRYADSKDKTTLLTALLQAKGIRAVPALIRGGERYTWQEIPLLVAFNHTLAYLPEFDLYLDATLLMAPFDSLATALRGRPVLVAADGNTQATVRQTPAVDASRDRAVSLTTATLAADGGVTGTTRMLMYGSQDAQLRTMLTQLSSAQLPQLVKAFFDSSGQSGTAKATLGNLKDFSQPPLLSIEFNAPDRVSLPGPGALSGSFAATGPGVGTSFTTAMLVPERKLDFPCPVGGVEQQLELALPPQVKITTLPPAADVQSAYGRYTASYAVKDGKLLVQEKLALTQPATVCTPADHVELRKFAAAIDREVRRQVLFE